MIQQLFLPASIDVIVCHHVLEHAAAPVNVLKEIGRLLRTKGKLLLFVPYEKGKRTRRYTSECLSDQINSMKIKGIIVKRWVV